MVNQSINSLESDLLLYSLWWVFLIIIKGNICCFFSLFSAVTSSVSSSSSSSSSSFSSFSSSFMSSSLCKVIVLHFGRRRWRTEDWWFLYNLPLLWWAEPKFNTWKKVGGFFLNPFVCMWWWGGTCSEIAHYCAAWVLGWEFQDCIQWGPGEPTLAALSEHTGSTVTTTLTHSPGRSNEVSWLAAHLVWWWTSCRR